MQGLDDYDHDEKVLAYQRQIEEEVALNSKLVGPLQKFTSIVENYAKNSIYKEKLNDLAKNYSFIRLIRGDGNCFYRAFAFGYFEFLNKNKSYIDKFSILCKNYKDQIVKSGTDDYIIDDFYQSIETVLTKIRSNESESDLEILFNEDGISNYIIIYLRLITSKYLRNHSDFFSNFLEGYDSIEKFCAQEVEVMNKESDHIHILAITSALDAKVIIEYLDNNKDVKGSNRHVFGENEDKSPTLPVMAQICLLYKPGHYDIIYPKIH